MCCQGRKTGKQFAIIFLENVAVCNYDKKFLNQIDLPPFYQQILWCFLELKTLYESDIGQEMILFNNKEILVGNRPIFLKSWFESGIVSIQDILSENGIFLFF